MNIFSVTPNPSLSAAVAAAPTDAYEWGPFLDGLIDGDDERPDFNTVFAVAAHTGTVPDPGTVDSYGHTFAGECTDVWEDCPGCEAIITPRAAYLLHAGAEVCGDMLRDELASLTDVASSGLLSALLPPFVCEWLDTAPAVSSVSWLLAFIDSVGVIAAKLACGQVPYPTCTAEEMALHIILDDAEDILDDRILVGDDGNWENLVTVGRRDTDLGALREVLFEDHDVLMMFDGDILDGPMAPNSVLHPANWFRPFRPAA